MQSFKRQNLLVLEQSSTKMFGKRQLDTTIEKDWREWGVKRQGRVS